MTGPEKKHTKLSRHTETHILPRLNRYNATAYRRQEDKSDYPGGVSSWKPRQIQTIGRRQRSMHWKTTSNFKHLTWCWRREVKTLEWNDAEEESALIDKTNNYHSPYFLLSAAQGWSQRCATRGQSRCMKRRSATRTLTKLLSTN